MTRFCRLLYLLLFGFAMAGWAQTPPTNSQRFQFREPRLRSYRVEQPRRIARAPAQPGEWLRAWPENGSTNFVEVGSRLVIHLKPGADVNRLIGGRRLKIDRVVAPNVYVVQADDAWGALSEADRLARLPEVTASYPVIRPPIRLQGQYAPAPNDPYFPKQWHLENRDTNGASLGIDLNARAAWPLSRGDGMTVAVVDTGVELTHPDLSAAALGSPHFNFFLHTANGGPSAPSAYHGTSVAGLVAARGDNKRGVSGVAPNAKFASWVIFNGNNFAVDSVGMMDMFQYQSNNIAVQNHSWATGGTYFYPASAIEGIAISNAVTLGRGGRGVVILRAAGNFRQSQGDANADGYAADPRVITVGAARNDGRAAKYSNPGACLLVAAPSSEFTTNSQTDFNFPTLATTDRQGSIGYNQAVITGTDSADYCINFTGFTGTSGACPQISGVAALVLAANTNLTWRDVQQILLLASRHFDLTDPDLSTNGAGLRVSHNVGFGIPDAGQAVALARRWISRPSQVRVSVAVTNTQLIPDDGLRVELMGAGIPAGLTSIPATPSFGFHPDVATASLPLVDVGLAAGPLAQNLHDRGALILRGGNFFINTLGNAAAAGAAFAVIASNTGGDARDLMQNTDFVPIPAVMISQTNGYVLRQLLATNPAVQARLHLLTTSYTFNVTNTLICEQVGLHIFTDHPRRGDVRLTLMSPQGTRSVLQRLNTDTSAGPDDWTYYSTHHFFESSAGNWTLEVSDESPGTVANVGNLLSAELIVLGVSILDTDHDGLDDNWEMARFGTPAFGPKDDPDGDGYNNAVEQAIGSDPQTAPLFTLDLSQWNNRLARLNWPSSRKLNYEVLAATDAGGPWTTVTNLPGKFPETEWFVPDNNGINRLFRVQSVEP